MYMNEFRFERFEILCINKSCHLFNNFVVFATGILEICVGTILIFASKKSKVLKFASFLIRDGIENVVDAVKATIQGKKINFKDFAKKKTVNYYILL